MHLPRDLLAQGASVKASRVQTWRSVTLSGKVQCWGGTGGKSGMVQSWCSGVGCQVLVQGDAVGQWSGAGQRCSAWCSGAPCAARRSAAPSVTQWMCLVWLRLVQHSLAVPDAVMPSAVPTVAVPSTALPTSVLVWCCLALCPGWCPVQQCPVWCCPAQCSLRFCAQHSAWLSFWFGAWCDTAQFRAGTVLPDLVPHSVLVWFLA